LVKIFFFIFEFLFYLIAIRNTFTRAINNAKDFLADPTKNMNKLTKDDKVINKLRIKIKIFD
jgi:hypothetical protein